MKTILFVCPHGAAKSVIAAAEFQRLAQQHGLPWQALCGGTEPDDAITPAVLAWLRAEGLPLPQRLPQPVTHAEFACANRVVSLNCTVRARLPPEIALEQWDDVPPVSQDLPTARARLRAHVEHLIHDRHSNP